MADYIDFGDYCKLMRKGNFMQAGIELQRIYFELSQKGFDTVITKARIARYASIIYGAYDNSWTHKRYKSARELANLDLEKIANDLKGLMIEGEMQFEDPEQF